MIPGLKCRFGYEVIPTGDGCVLKARICEEGNRLNYDETKCIPGSENWVPFPILILAVLASIVPIVSKVRNKETRLVANLICVLSITETIAIIVQVALANEFGIRPVLFLTGMALCFLYCTNVFFLIIYHK